MSKCSRKGLVEEIDLEKQRLRYLVNSERDLRKKETYEQSCKLDSLVVEYMRNQLGSKFGN
ncbi:hypothetical protein GGQ84_002144 [Desulfitispora alkaliphila]|uniref:aspartyl-phosphate phosphatase Spo0E family protein n=1 Tax=Desulfitispora alkaliphila TaxID=622674 RepID=UPI003D253354